MSGRKAHPAKNIRRFYGQITSNQLPVHFTLYLQAPVNMFRNQAQYGSKAPVLCLVILFSFESTALSNLKKLQYVYLWFSSPDHVSVTDEA